MGQVAGVLAHEIGHVVERHGAERLTKARLKQGLSGAVIIAAYDPERPETMRAAQVALAIGHLVTMKYGRNDELESDKIGVQYMADAGYDPRAMIQVMRVLQNASRGGVPEFFSTHPNPERRIERIENAIAEIYPDSVPATLQP